jgi:hypothetical protein
MSGPRLVRKHGPLRPETKYRLGLPAPQAWPGGQTVRGSADVHRWWWRLSLTRSLSRCACTDGQTLASGDNLKGCGQYPWVEHRILGSSTAASLRPFRVCARIANEGIVGQRTWDTLEGMVRLRYAVMARACRFGRKCRSRRARTMSPAGAFRVRHLNLTEVRHEHRLGNEAGLFAV